MATAERREIVVGIDPARDWHLPLAWASDEAHHRGIGLRLVVAVPPPHRTRQVDDTPARRLCARRALKPSRQVTSGRGNDTWGSTWPPI